MTDTHHTAIVLTGATGATGNAVAHALADRTDLDVTLAAVVAPSVATAPTRPLPSSVPAFADLDAALAATRSATVVVDFTHAEPALAHIETSLAAGLPIVVGATGFADGALAAVGERFAAADLGLLVVPNFSLGAVLMMRLATQLAAHFADVEIVETHHDGKRDSPSGTAVAGAHKIAAARRAAGLEPGPAAATADQPGRGTVIDGVPVHALRLPGATAHEEIIFGAPGELITLRHDAIDRGCYAAGVARAAQRIDTVRGLATGLETVL